MPLPKLQAMQAETRKGWRGHAGQLGSGRCFCRVFLIVVTISYLFFVLIFNQFPHHYFHLYWRKLNTNEYFLSPFHLLFFLSLFFLLHFFFSQTFCFFIFYIYSNHTTKKKQQQRNQFMAINEWVPPWTCVLFFCLYVFQKFFNQPTSLFRVWYCVCMQFRRKKTTSWKTKSWRYLSNKTETN